MAHAEWSVQNYRKVNDYSYSLLSVSMDFGVIAPDGHFYFWMWKEAI